jgi:hypothetical protein
MRPKRYKTLIGRRLWHDSPEQEERQPVRHLNLGLL